jgi:hypothetical protein
MVLRAGCRAGRAPQGGGRVHHRRRPRSSPGTRLTDGHSKKWENHEAALALFIAYYNYCRVHMTLTQATRGEGETLRKVTPAIAAGLTDHVWSVAELLEAVGVPE